MLNPNDVSPDVRELNPDLFQPQAERQPVVTSRLEEKFLNLWTGITRRQLEREYRFSPMRKWRFDFAHPNTKVAIEIEGGIWSQGRHTRGQGYVDDCEKYNEAEFMGWTVFRLPSPMITPEYVRRIHQYISMEAE